MTGNVLSPAQQIKMQYEHYQATHQARAPAAHKWVEEHNDDHKLWKARLDDILALKNTSSAGFFHLYYFIVAVKNVINEGILIIISQEFQF